MGGGGFFGGGGGTQILPFMEVGCPHSANSWRGHRDFAKNQLSKQPEMAQIRP